MQLGKDRPTEQPMGSNTSSRFRVPPFEEPPPLDEWLQGREIISVKQDGTAMFTNIQDALNALRSRQVVEILDRGAEREKGRMGCFLR